MKRWLLNVVLVAVVIAPCVVSARPKRPEPQERGSGYSPLRPPNGCKRVRMVWNTYCRAPEGKGLAIASGLASAFWFFDASSAASSVVR